MFSNSQPDRKDGDSSGDEEAQWKKLGHAAMPAMLFGHLFLGHVWPGSMPFPCFFKSFWFSLVIQKTSPYFTSASNSSPQGGKGSRSSTKSVTFAPGTGASDASDGSSHWAASLNFLALTIGSWQSWHIMAPLLSFTGFDHAPF